MSVGSNSSSSNSGYSSTAMSFTSGTARRGGGRRKEDRDREEVIFVLIFNLNRAVTKKIVFNIAGRGLGQKINASRTKQASSCSLP
jgi:hypothetical protein